MSGLRHPETGLRKNIIRLDQVFGLSSALSAISAGIVSMEEDISNLSIVVDGKEPKITSGNAGQYWTGEKTWATLNKSAVGLPNVDNTGDEEKPVSIAQAAALALKVNISTLAGTSGSAMVGTAPFSGSIIPDGSTAQQAMQSLESAEEAYRSNILSKDPAKGGDLVGFSQAQTGDVGTVAGRLLQEIYVTDAPYNAVGDNSTDCIAAFNAATADAIAGSKRLVIPRGSYVLSEIWSVTSPIDIISDPSTNLRWTNEASAGLDLDFRAAGSNFGLNTVKLGGLYAPSVLPNFNFPGYPAAWDAADRSERDAITLRGGSRINIETQYIMGWNAEFRPMGTYDGTHGARAPLNVNFRNNTGDINTYGVYFDGGPANAASMGAIHCEWNTCFAKFPVYYDTALHEVSQCNAKITGQSFVNEAGGATVFAKGSGVKTCSVDIHWCYAGYSGYDSPTGTPATLTLPLVAGDVPSNGLTTDGNASVGYFAGSNNTIRVGLALDQSAYPGGAVPAGGVVTRVRDVGANNRITVGLYEQSQAAAVALSTTQGETNYGGGVGEASISRVTLVSITVPTLENFSAATFYFYNSLLSDGLARPIRIVPFTSDMANSGLHFLAKDNAAMINREGIIEVTNLTGGSVTGATYFAWVVLDA